MTKPQIAVIGDKNITLIFKSANCEVFSPHSENETKAVLSKLVTEFSLILITEKCAKQVEDIIEDFKTKAYPVILVIPDSAKESDYATGKIREDMRHSLGINLKLD